ncbi:MAG TPA: methyltransferase domain-containing protein [Blastocatellia bacterium]|nr:methyltransferase domain-containing protein [Blastocatellia bacterium]
MECFECKSLYCDPMPDAQTLARMYGPEYESGYASEPVIEVNKDRARIVEWLEKIPKGTFIDYGCGTGELLREAARLGWDTIGVEFEEEVAKSIEARTGVRVVSCSRVASMSAAHADILHLGDVIEHLTALNRQMPEILRLIRPGGLLIAQGPLEANTTVFTSVVRLMRPLRRKQRGEIAPYHVMLATLKGQKELFRRFGLEEIEFSVREVAWPAPDKLSISDLGNLRSVALFTARRFSQAVSALRPDRWGNRYFYVGHRVY